jgi:hypothetical protein
MYAPTAMPIMWVCVALINKNRLTPAPPDRLRRGPRRPFGKKVILCGLVWFKSAAGEPHR